MIRVYNRSADYLSRMSRGSTHGPQGGYYNPMGRFYQPQDRYLPIIISLENQDLLDEHTGNLLKQLVLEENVEIFRLINSFIAKVIDDQELCAMLIRLAQ